MMQIKVFARGKDGMPIELGTILSNGKRVRASRSLKPILKQLLFNAKSKNKTAALGKLVPSLPELLCGSRLWAVAVRE